MKKLAVITVFFIAISASCLTLTGLFPLVPYPSDDSESMLVVEIGTGIPGDSEWLINTSYSGWAPLLLDPEGNEVLFINNESVSALDTLFYAPNLDPGTYTFLGFMHVYADYSLFDSGSTIISYGPYENYPYHVRQVFEFANPVQVSVKPGTMDSLGRYFVEFSQKGGSSNDRWKVLEGSFSYTRVIPDDRNALKVIKQWATPEWLAWNTRNPETAMDQ